MYVPHEETFPLPLNYVDVMRPATTSIDNASEHTLNDFWTDERKVGTTRFPNLLEQTQEDIAAWDEEEIRLQEARRKRGIFDVSSEDTEHLKVICDA